MAGDRADLLLLSGHDDGEGVFANMGLPAEGRKPYFAFSSAILVINSVVGGGAAAIAAGAFLDASLGVAVAVGIAAVIVSVVTWIRYADRLLDAGAAQTEPLFPSPARSGADRRQPEERLHRGRHEPIRPKLLGLGQVTADQL